jgi:hypothetical protein
MNVLRKGSPKNIQKERGKIREAISRLKLRLRALAAYEKVMRGSPKKRAKSQRRRHGNVVHISGLPRNQ